MYNFTELTNPSRAEPQGFASDELMINGRALSELVKGYRHLTVKGRGIHSRRIKTTEIPGRRGVWVDLVEESETILEIQYMLTAETSAELRDRFQTLNKWLRYYGPSGFLEVSFKDEPEWIYYALFTDADDFEENSLSVMSSFKLLVPDGVKKRAEQGSTGAITLNDAYEVLPDRIVLTPEGTVNRIEITNGREKLIINGSYKSDTDIILDFTGDEVRLDKGYTGISILSELELHSPLEEFKVRHGDMISAKGARVKWVRWRDERL